MSLRRARSPEAPKMTIAHEGARGMMGESSREPLSMQ
jgi:hypothetical protein